MIRRMKEWMEYKGIQPKDLIGVTFAFRMLGTVVFFGILSLFY